MQPISFNPRDGAPFWVLCLGAAMQLSACGADDRPTPTVEEEEDHAYGSVALALRATGSSGNVYQLVDAQVRFTGPVTATVDADPDEDTLEVDLPTGPYDVLLLDGWQLVQLMDGGSQASDARLVSENPTDVAVAEGLVSDVGFLFDVSGELIPFGLGRARINIEVFEGSEPEPVPEPEPPSCGDGSVDPGEECDASNLAGQTCAGLGFSSGTLSCTPNCAFDTAACVAATCDPDGTYRLSSPINYNCCGTGVNVDVFSQLLSFSSDGGVIQGDSPPLTGAPTTCPTGSFTNTGVVDGSCEVTHQVVGTFTGEHTWSGSYRLLFDGDSCSCFGGLFGTPCEDQLFVVSATRQP